MKIPSGVQFWHKGKFWIDEIPDALLNKKQSGYWPGFTWDSGAKKKDKKPDTESK